MKLTLEQLEHMRLFSSVTRADCKDVLVADGKVVFIIAQGQVQRALGEGGKHLKRLERLLKRPVRFIGFHADPVKFIKNLQYPTRVESVVFDDGVVIIKAGDARSKGRVFGRERSNLTFMQSLVKRYFGDVTIKVV